MIFKLFSIYDEKARAYLPPFILPERGQAIRIFTDCVNSNDHQFGKHPSDYTLFELGTFDDSSSEISRQRSAVGNGVEFITPQEITNYYPEPDLQRSAKA